MTPSARPIRSMSARAAPVRSPECGAYIGRSRSGPASSSVRAPRRSVAASAARRIRSVAEPYRIVPPIPTMSGAAPGRGVARMSAQRDAEPEGDLPDELVGAPGGERVHERAGANIAIGAGDRVPAAERGAADERQGAVDQAGGRLVDERLDRLRLGEQRGELLVRAVGVGMRGLVLVDQAGAAGQRSPADPELD